jgi:DNA methylase
MAKRRFTRPSSPKKWAAQFPSLVTAYSTKLGISLVGESDKLLAGPVGKWLKGKVQLVFTSPPFPLNRKKAYDNKQGKEYKAWLKDFAPLLRDLLAPNGSIVIELGNAWEPGLPVMSTLALESLLAFKRSGRFHLCQEFIWYNPAKLPTPVQWVSVDRVRVKDAFTRLWWLSSTPHPHADNTQVLQPYSSSMRDLLKTKKYNSGLRPSEHRIGKESFLTNNGGAIPPNVLRVETTALTPPDSVLTGSNTSSTDTYLKYCRDRDISPHPARMPRALAEFFVKLCTRPGDLVLDPFAGSNTTGAAAERHRRCWIGVEAKAEYAQAGLGRFVALSGKASHGKSDR